MKSLLGKLGVILIIILFFVVGCQIPVKKDEYSKGADWMFYAKTDLFTSYYDSKSIRSPSKDVVRVWTKREVTEKGIIDAVKHMGEEFRNLSYELILWEINCAEKRNRGLSIEIYTKEGEVIGSRSSPAKWEFIVPGSVAEKLYIILCE
jgi:hypothetical protein